MKEPRWKHWEDTKESQGQPHEILWKKKAGLSKLEERKTVEKNKSESKFCPDKSFFGLSGGWGVEFHTEGHNCLVKPRTRVGQGNKKRTELLYVIKLGGSFATLQGPQEEVENPEEERKQEWEVEGDKETERDGDRDRETEQQ